MSALIISCTSIQKFLIDNIKGGLQLEFVSINRININKSQDLKQDLLSSLKAVI